jgi:SIR2-like domain
MAEHDPKKFAHELSTKLATRSRHLCAFLGAGVGRACGLPDVVQLQTQILNALTGDDRVAFEEQLKGRNLEQALSRLRRIAVLLTDNQKVDGLTATRAAELDATVCQKIVSALDISAANLNPMYSLAAWALSVDHHLPLEIFTVNYDLLIETALERRGVPYFDGFIGNLRPRFQTELVEARPGKEEAWLPGFLVRLWKLHGSVNWSWGPDQQVVRMGQPVTKDLAAAIYPSDTKYDESRRVPFVVLQDRLRRALYQPETLVLISGYSFSDDHLNELLFDAAARRQRSELIVFCYAKIPHGLAQRALITPNMQVVTATEAILGGVRARWKSTTDIPNVWQNDELLLHDFSELAAYLARSSVREPNVDAFLSSLLGAVATAP